MGLAPHMTRDPCALGLSIDESMSSLSSSQPLECCTKPPARAASAQAQQLLPPPKESLTCEIVFGLADIHPVAREREGEQALVARDERERLLFDAGRAQLNAVQHPGAEDVDASIDLIPHKHLGPHTQAAAQLWSANMLISCMLASWSLTIAAAAVAAGASMYVWV